MVVTHEEPRASHDPRPDAFLLAGPLGGTPYIAVEQYGRPL